MEEVPNVKFNSDRCWEEGEPSDHEQAGQRQDQGGGGGEGGASLEAGEAGGRGFQEVGVEGAQGPEDEGMKWSGTRIGVWQREVSGGLGWGDWWRTAKEARPGTLRRGGGGKADLGGLVSQKPGRRER